MGTHTSPPGSKLPTSLQSRRHPASRANRSELVPELHRSLGRHHQLHPSQGDSEPDPHLWWVRLLKAIVFKDIRVISLSGTGKCALIIPVPDMKRFNPKPAFGDSTAHTWALVHGTFVPGATAILIEGLIRPADWEHNDDPQRSQLPTFGFFGIGTTPLKFPLQKGRP